MNQINYQQRENDPPFNIITVENEPKSDKEKEDILVPLLPKENPTQTIFWCVIKFKSESLLNSTKRFGYYFVVCVRGQSINQYDYKAVKLTRPKKVLNCFHITKENAIQISKFILREYTALSMNIASQINKLSKSDIICLEDLTTLVHNNIFPKYLTHEIRFDSFQPIPTSNKGGKQLKRTQRKKRTHHKKHTRRYRKH